MDDALHGAVCVIADRIGALFRRDDEFSHVGHELPRDRIVQGRLRRSLRAIVGVSATAYRSATASSDKALSASINPERSAARSTSS
jgi:hypothetical protein